MQGDPTNRSSRKRRALACVLGFLLGIALFYGAKFGIRFLSARRQALALRDRLASKELLFPSYEEHGILPEAFVLLLSVRSDGGHMELKGPTVGFTVGDGAYVLTAEHVVTAVTTPSSKATCREDFILSLHYGDLFPFDVVTRSAEHDASLLRPHWPSHPALTLDTPKDLVAPLELYVVGGCVVETDFLQGASTVRTIPTLLNKRIRMEELSLLQGSRSSAAHHLIAMEDNRFILPGWSGSAVVDAASGRVIGLLTNHKPECFASMVLSHYAMGRNVAAIELVAGSEAVKGSLRAVASAAPRPPEAERCYTLFLQCNEHMRNREIPKAIETLKALRGLRPKSAPLARMLGYIARAGGAEDPNQGGMEPLAEAAFLDAIELAPQDAHAHAALARLFQDQGKRREALRHAKAALTVDPNHPLALLTSVTLRRYSDPNAVLNAASELVRRFPERPLYWHHYSETLFNVGHYLEAKEAGKKAVALDSTRPYRRPLARALAKLGQLKEAEEILKGMAKQCACQRCWYEYASFLVDYRKGDLEALAGADRACEQISSAAKRDGMEEAQVRLKEQIRAARAALGREPGPGIGVSL